ncbi:MAG: carboxyl transferase [Eubacterium sp.]|nr:carboxyl transferase [Eubacterium sp.]
MSETKKYSAGERIAALLDDASFVEIGAYVTARSTDFNLKEFDTPKDGVLTGYGLIDGKLVYVYSQDASVLGGAIGEMHAKKIANLYNLAMKCGAPVIGILDCAGLRLQEATDALTAFGRIFKKMSLSSGVIPQITAVMGTCGGGTAMIPSLTDFTFMTGQNSHLYVNSPNALEGNFEGKVDTSAAAYVSENTGLVDGVFETEDELLAEIRKLISYLPANNEDLAIVPCGDELNRTIPGIEAMNMEQIIVNIADDLAFYEIKKAYAPDMKIGFIRLNGATIGVTANADKTLTTAGMKKAARFVRFCDAFSIPVLTMVDARNFAATMEEEKTISAAAAELAFAYSDATVEKVTVVTGEAYGSAYITMDSKSLGADMVYAWPTAKIGMMDAGMAVRIMYASELSSVDDKAAKEKELAKEYTELQGSALSAARRGYIDDIIEPDATRKRVIAAFEMLSAKQEERPGRKHSAL